MINRIEKNKQIKQKGFDMTASERVNEVYSNSDFGFTDFSKIRLGLKTLDDAIINVGSLKKINPRYADKNEVLRAIHNSDYETMRDISTFYYKTSGIYNRLCRYMAYLYRYDWMITPYITDNKLKKEKVLEGFHKALLY